MSDLFVRTVSQGLQAFLPIAFGLAEVRRRDRADAVAGIRWGLFAAAIASIPAGWLLQQSLRQSLWEAMLALFALGALGWSIHAASHNRSASPLMLAAVTVLLVTRQTMEIDAVFTVAAFQIRSRDAVMAIGSATSLAIALAGSWAWVAGRFGARAYGAAVRVFVVLFVSQLAMYAFHESAEARLLPWSDALHAATEPYGPDGIYGRHFAWFLIALPLATAAAVASRKHWPRQLIPTRPARVSGFAIVACLAVIALAGGLSRRTANAGAVASPDEVATMANAPHLLFRHTGIDPDYNTLSIALLANPAGRRLSVGLPCERVAFAAGRGICLQAARGVFTTYRAVLFDQQFKLIASSMLSGSPSRTRVASDGRVGAITVFVTGHGYGASPFSTKTTLVDMASGDTLGDLEQFATWRDGTRFKAQDFNYWGVTFGRNSNNFYATLGTGGRTYLVRGDLGLRKLTVLYEGVECPSLSPDERLIAFKKRTGTGSGNWKLAILDLTTMRERPLASEIRNIDDQVEWLDDAQVLYMVPRQGSAVTDVWVAPIAGAVPAKVFVAAAESPIVVRAFADAK
jgi:hypothetical protein